MSGRLLCARSVRLVERNRNGRGLGALLGVVLALAAMAYGAPGFGDFVAARDGMPGHEALRRAFANRYNLDITQRVELTLSNDRGSHRRRVLEMANKRIKGRLHSLGRFTHPPHLRGTTLLVIENRDRSDDQFVLLPGTERIRRIGQGRRGDAFMGTDFSYEDLERYYAETFEIVGSARADLGGEPVLVIRARPRVESAYHLSEFWVSPADFAILRVRYFGDDGEGPVKILEAPRETMREFDGHVLPTVMSMRDLRRGTRTEARFEEIVVNPELEDSLFSGAALESGRAIPMGRKPVADGATSR